MPAFEPLAEAISGAESAAASKSAAAPEVPAVQPVHAVSQSSNVERARELLIRANKKKEEKRQKKLETIMAEVEKSEKISNDRVQELLKCSDATATRYLAMLVKQGKVRKVGTRGAGVVYVRA